MTLRTALDQGTKILADAAVSVPRLTAEVLLAYALQRDRVFLFAHLDEELPELGWIHFGRYLHQRTSGIPTQYITKTQEFYGRPFRVTPAVLIPRPETEHAVAVALHLISPRSRIVDVGTGSGAIAVTLALEMELRVFAADISLDALCIAARNASALGASVEFLCSDLLSSLSPVSMDAVVSNPPYVGLNEAEGLQREVRDHEPHLALFAGEDGTVVYRKLVKDAERVLKPGGVLIVELGYRSLDAVWAMLGEGWSDQRYESDLAGIPRVLAARWRA